MRTIDCVVTVSFGVYLVLCLFCFVMCGGVCVCLCGLCNVWVCACVGFVMCACVHVYGL